MLTDMKARCNCKVSESNYTEKVIELLLCRKRLSRLVCSIIFFSFEMSFLFSYSLVSFFVGVSDSNKVESGGACASVGWIVILFFFIFHR